MNPFEKRLPTTRREFLTNSARGIGLLAYNHYAPAFLTGSAMAGAPAAEKDRTIFVLIQLAGGNDGLNTLVPFEDDRYYRLRPRLALKKSEVLRIEDGLGFHPACREMAELYAQGKVGIIQNVGYPNPNRSHFRSSEIWETASASNEFLSSGWMGRYFDHNCLGNSNESDPVGVHLGRETPQSFFTETPHNLFGMQKINRGKRIKAGRELLENLAHAPAINENSGFLSHTLMNALATEKRVQAIAARYRPGVDYPTTRLAASLRGIAAMIASGLQTRVYFASQTGYDTHANQLPVQNRLLGELSGSLEAFQNDLKAHGLEDQVLTMTFSEFGRRPIENNDGGTDHGTAAPLFVMGSKIKNNILGAPPDLNIDKGQDLTHTTDFRQVYATVLDKWLDCSSEPILGRKFAPLPFV